MKLTEISKSDIPRRAFKSTKIFNVLEQFVASGYEAALVEEEGRDVNSIRGSLNNAIARFGINGVKVVCRGDNTYLVRKD